MPMLQVTPFIPGTARGILRPASEQIAPDSIALLTQQALRGFNARPAGIVVVDGAPFSHPMIRLFDLGIPAVAVSSETAGSLIVGSEVVIDGWRGSILQPVDAAYAETAAPEPPPSGKPVFADGGAEVALLASVSGVEGVIRAVKQGAAAIGLVRTEFLVPDDGGMPDTRYYLDVFSGICEAAGPLPVTMRLLDIASDKPVPWLKPFAGVNGPLGLQGVRLYDREPVRSAVYAMVDTVARLRDRYELKLLIPYVVSKTEFRHWRLEIEQRLGSSLPIGVMAETPVAVLDMQNWFEVADFVTIGCNDLMQCLFAADRDLPELRDYLDPYSPVLFRFLRQAAEAAGGHINKVQLCGLLPRLPGVLPVLLGMGFRAFSVEPVMIPYLAQVTRGITVAHAVDLAQQVCAAKDSQQVREQLIPGAG